MQLKGRTDPDRGVAVSVEDADGKGCAIDEDPTRSTVRTSWGERVCGGVGVSLKVAE